MNVIELFAGAGGLALGLEKAGFETVFLNEFDKRACETLKLNKKWEVIEKDVKDIDFSIYYNQIDLISGGIPCQPFSHAGKRLGIEDTRGTLFYEFARAVKESNPKMFLLENVKGLKTHNEGRTLLIIKEVLSGLGYDLSEAILDASYFEVPQKRERLFLIGKRIDLNIEFKFPKEKELTVLRDVLFKGKLYDSDVPKSEGVLYSKEKEKILKLVPEGGNWKNLPLKIQEQYLGGAFLSGGGKTGIAKRCSFNKPSPTLLCSPAQKQTERCHPIETRPFTIREYARIQTFPDNYIFSGSKTDQYKQIGNAVPVNLAYNIGLELMKSLKNIKF